MAVQARVDSVALDTATGDQTVSPGSLSFTPTGVIFVGNKLTADGGAADANLFVGAAASASDERYMAFESEDASAAADVGAVALANGCMSGLADNNVVDFVGDFTSFNASPAGISFNLSNAPAAASILNFLLLGGDITGIQTFVLNLGTGTGNVSISSLSGTPSCVIFFAAAAVSSGDTFAAATSNGTNMVGWMCANGTQGVCGSRHTDGASAGDTARWQRTDRCVDFRSVSADLANAAFVSMDANGFTISVNTPTDSIRVYGVAIYGGVWRAGSFTSSTTTGTTPITTTGCAPKVSMFQTFGNAADTATVVNGRRGFGMSDGTRRWAVAYDDLDGSDPTVTDNYLDRTRALVSITAGTPTLNDAYDVTHDAEGFTYDHEVASGVAIQVIYLVGGDTPAVAGVSVNVNDSDTATEDVTVRISVNVVALDVDTATELVDIQRSPLLVDVADTSPAAEDVSVSIPRIVEVVDTVSTAEAVDIQRSPLLVDVSDAVASAEAVTVQIPMSVVVSDDTPASEAVAVTVNPLTVTVFDDDAATELVQVTLNPLLVNVVDDDVATEAVTVAIPMAAVVFDNDVATEAVAVTVNPLTISVDDTDLAAELVTVVIPLAVVVVDDDVATEAVAVASNSLTVSVDDTNLATELATIAIPMAVVVSDDDVPAEAVDIQRSPLLVNVADDDVAADAVDVRISMQVVAADATVGTDTAEVLINPLVPEVFDAVASAELVAVTVNPLVPSVVDVIVTAEAVTVQISLDVVVFDADTPTEAVALELNPLLVSVADDTPSSDVVELALNPLLVMVTDDTTVGESVLVSAGQVLVVAVSDAVTPSELVNVLVNPITVAVVDDTPAAESVAAAMLLQTFVFDTVSTQEQVAGELSLLLVSVFDAAPPTEAVAILSPYVFAVADDNLEPDEFVQLGLSGLAGPIEITVSDSETISERRLVLSIPVSALHVGNDRIRETTLRNQVMVL